MSQFLTSLTLLSLAILSVSCIKSYDGYKIIRLTPENKDHIQVLVGLEKQNVSLRIFSQSSKLFFSANICVIFNLLGIFH